MYKFWHCVLFIWDGSLKSIFIDNSGCVGELGLTCVLFPAAFLSQHSRGERLKRLRGTKGCVPPWLEVWQFLYSPLLLPYIELILPFGVYFSSSFIFTVEQSLKVFWYTTFSWTLFCLRFVMYFSSKKFPYTGYVHMNMNYHKEYVLLAIKSATLKQDMINFCDLLFRNIKVLKWSALSMLKPVVSWL